MDIPSFETFKQDIKAIYPDGNLIDAYNRLKWHYANTQDFSDPNIYSLILTKFKDHVENWKRKNGERDEKYVSDATRKELKNIMDFLGAFMWRMEFGGLTQSKARDKYLFPDVPLENLANMLKEFKDEEYRDRKDPTTSYRT